MPNGEPEYKHTCHFFICQGETAKQSDARRRNDPCPAVPGKNTPSRQTGLTVFCQRTRARARLRARRAPAWRCDATMYQFASLVFSLTEELRDSEIEAVASLLPCVITELGERS